MASGTHRNLPSTNAKRIIERTGMNYAPREWGEIDESVIWDKVMRYVETDIDRIQKQLIIPKIVHRLFKILSLGPYFH